MGLLTKDQKWSQLLTISLFTFLLTFSNCLQEIDSFNLLSNLNYLNSIYSNLIPNDEDFKITNHEENAPPSNKRYRGPFRKMFHDEDLNVPYTEGVDPGEPLFLTPLLEAGKTEEAQKLSKVRLGHRYGHSFSGFFTVNKKYNSNLFFWFFPARTNAATAPVVVWLQGGPGGSSLFGLFAENGPFYVNEEQHLLHRNYSWNYELNVLYIDNPVGTGFSFTDREEGYARNEADVGRDLYSALTQFYQLFPELDNNDLYITGESYAGKYVPAITYTIHKNNPTAIKKMNLKGMAIGDGLCDPISMTDYGDFLYQLGLLDQHGRTYFKEQGQLVINYIQNKEWTKAFKVFDTLLNGDTIGSKSYFYNVTGLSNYYNFLLQEEPKILKANNYKVLIYNGQLDIIIASPLTDNFINGLDFQYSDLLKNATRHIWRVDGEVAGYVREVPNFAQVLIRDAGHMVPYDQPKWAYKMITRFTLGKRII
ncbi:putative serine carboxypeptidase CPVL [Armadillidium vulgare]|nr:putative serine carboxypeptidase CPVL [Armadillidium vulgare]